MAPVLTELGLDWFEQVLLQFLNLLDLVGAVDALSFNFLAGFGLN